MLRLFLRFVTFESRQSLQVNIMGDKARVKENTNFVKDLDNMVILNTNKAAIAKHNQKMAELNRAKQMESEINNLKSEVSDMKNMLSQILKAVGGEK